MDTNYIVWQMRIILHLLKTCFPFFNVCILYSYINMTCEVKTIASVLKVYVSVGLLLIGPYTETGKAAASAY